MRALTFFCCLAAVSAAFAAPPQGDTCRELVERSLAVERSLLSVNDRETADSAAERLEIEFAALQRMLKGLSEHPHTEDADRQKLEQTMQSLLYITQRYLPVVQRVEEVNAYGSEHLMAVLQRYKQSAPRHEAGESAETPQSRAQTEWAEAAEDVLYLLRQVQDETDAEETALSLPLAVEHLQTCRLRAQALRSTSAARPDAALKNLPRLQAELKGEAERLQQNNAFGVPSLLPMAEKAVRAAE